MRRWVSRSLALGLLLATLGISSRGADALAPQVAKLQLELVEAIQAGDHAKAVTVGKKIVELAPQDADAHYNLACAWGRQGDRELAIASLAKAIERGYSDPAYLKTEEDFAALREDPRFVEFQKGARANDLKGGFEKGAELPGVKTVEEHPEGGLRYRLRMSPQATEAKPNRLIVWFHPSGGSMNGVVDRFVPLLLEHGFALLVTTKKQLAGWDEREVERLLELTLPEVEKVAGLDASKPLLMGFSAGGQVALKEWAKKPGAFSGLILNAAYPMDAEKQIRGEVVPMELPKGEELKKVPMFVLMGDQDGGAKIWKAVEQDWKKAGVPLTLRWVPGAKHQWLFDKTQTEELGKWLSALAAGKVPADKPAP